MALLEEENLDAIAAAFLAVVPPDRIEKTKRALSILLPAYNSGSIFNSEFQQWKTIVDRSFEEAYSALVRTDHTTYWEPDGETVSTRGQISKEMGRASGIRSSIALTKQAAKLKFDHPLVGEVKKLLAVCVPIAQIFEKLKTMVVKGKKPPSPEQVAKKQAQLAKKTVKTCGCCFRPIAVLPNGKIADHGYTIPHPGLKGGSCPGRKFQPLEVSSDGLKFMVQLHQGWIENIEELLKKAPTLTSVPKDSFSKKSEVVKKGEPDWDKAYKSYVVGLENDSERYSSQLKMYQKKLADWKPAKVDESLRELTSRLLLLI